MIATATMMAGVLLDDIAQKVVFPQKKATD